MHQIVLIDREIEQFALMCILFLNADPELRDVDPKLNAMLPPMVS